MYREGDKYGIFDLIMTIVCLKGGRKVIGKGGVGTFSEIALSLKIGKSNLRLRPILLDIIFIKAHSNIQIKFNIFWSNILIGREARLAEWVAVGS